MGRGQTGRVVGLGVLVVAAMAGGLSADARDDLNRVKSDVGSLRSHFDSVKSKLDVYLDGSVKLRALDKDQLNELVSKICRLDIETDGDDPARLANEMKEKAISRVKSEYDRTIDDGSRVFDDMGRLESEAKSLRSRARDLESNNDVKDDAARVREDLDKMGESIARLFETINSDRSTLDRVKAGVMNGANNPMVRACMDYGKEMHKKLQSDRRCDEKETVLSSGRPDCIKFDADDCKVIEFKPDTYSTSEAESQASGYLRDVRDKFKNDDRAKQCKQNSDGPIFRAVGELYPACKAS